MNTTGVQITAGLGGFLVLFALAVAVWFLGRDLTRRLRRMQVAEDRRVERDRAERQRAEQEQVSLQDDEDDPIG